jgi:hypothetical protein
VQRTAEGASLALRGHAAGGTVDVVGRLEGNTDELLVTLGGRGLDATALPILGERVRGLVDVRVDVSTNAGSLRANGRVAVRQGHVIGSGPTRLLRLSPDARTILAALDPAVAGDDLSFDDARAIFAWRRGAWRFPRIFVSRGPLIAGGRARVDARGAVSGYGTLRLPAELTRALQPYEPLLAAFLDGNGAATLPFAVGGSVRALQLTLGRPWL